MEETLISLGGAGLLRAIAHLIDSEAEELDAALGSVFSFLSMKEVRADDMWCKIDSRWAFAVALDACVKFVASDCLYLSSLHVL